MKTIWWVGGLVLAAAIAAQGATNDLATALQKGLFEEEANGNLGAAIQAYQSVANRFDQDRRLAATAIYRLGECYRKQGNTNDAATQFQRVVREFADQPSLAALSRQSLAALGVAMPIQGQPGPSGETQTAAGPAAPTSTEADEVKRIQALIKDSPDLINAADPVLGTTPLHRAAERGQLVVAQFLLANGADIEAKDTHQIDRTPLHFAAGAGHKAMVELLLSKGANVQATDRAGLTSLHLAAANGYRNVAEVLLDHQALVDARDRNGSTPLLLAAAHGFRSVMELLLAHGADINAATTTTSMPGGPGPATDFKGTALSIAAQRGDQSLAAFLLGKGAAVNPVNKDARTPLSYAAEGRQTSLVKLLLDAHANPNAGAVNLPLAMAAWSGDLDTLKLLLAHGADPNTNSEIKVHVRDFERTTCTALFLAVDRHYPEVIKALVEAKADPNSLGVDGDPVLFQALPDGPTVQALLEGGADPNRRGSSLSPLQAVLNWPIIQDELKRALVKLLLEHGAQPNVSFPNRYGFPQSTTKTGWTPLHTAAAAGDQPITELLLKHGAEVNAKGTVDGSTPLHLAVRNGNAEIVKLLLDRGADPNARDNAGATPLELAKTSAQFPPTPFAIPPYRPGMPASAAPGGSPGASASSTPGASIAELLRQHGALDDLPRMDAIEVRRPSTHYSSSLSNQGGDGANQITLAEAIAVQYGLLAGSPHGDPDWRSSYNLLNGNSFNQSLPFPDLAHVRIRKPAADLRSWQERKLDLSPLLERGDCSKDVALNWGEVVDIPEQDHSLDAHWNGFNAAQMTNLVNCLSRQVEVVIKGQATKVTLGPELRFSTRGPGLRGRSSFGGFGGDPWSYLVIRTDLSGQQESVDIRNVEKGTLWLKPALLHTKLVLASSDLSRVKVTRQDPATGKKREWVFDCTDGKPQPIFWLREGDVIEVPERSDVYSSAAPDSSAPAETSPVLTPFQQRLQNVIPKPQSIPRPVRIPATNPPATPPVPAGNPPADQ